MQLKRANPRSMKLKLLNDSLPATPNGFLTARASDYIIITFYWATPEDENLVHVITRLRIEKPSMLRDIAEVLTKTAEELEKSKKKEKIKSKR